MEQTMHELNEIFRDVFDNPAIEINENTVAADIEEWDSLNHILLVVAIEKHFKIKFTTQEIQQWKNAGEINASVKKRLAGK
jgi:acyl carrier protein